MTFAGMVAASIGRRPNSPLATVRSLPRDQNPPGAPRRSERPSALVSSVTRRNRANRLARNLSNTYGFGVEPEVEPEAEPEAESEVEPEVEPEVEHAVDSEVESEEEGVVVAVQPERAGVLARRIGMNPDHSTDSSFLKARRDRIKAPIKKIMELADEIQDDIKEDMYLKIANASKEVYKTIEELDPTTTEGYEIVRHTDGSEFTELWYMQNRISELEQRIGCLEALEHERVSEIDRLVNERDVQNVSISWLQRDLHEKDNRIGVLNLALQQSQEDTASCETVIVHQASHPIIGPRIVHSRAMESIRAGIDVDSKVNLVNARAASPS